MLLIMLLPGLGIIRIRYNGYNLSPQKPPHAKREYGV